MTKLEEKLIQLGYEWAGNTLSNCPRYYKYTNHNGMEYELCIVISLDKNKIFYDAVYVEHYGFETQTHIDNLQQAFNQLQKDLEVLKDEFK